MTKNLLFGIVVIMMGAGSSASAKVVCKPAEIRPWPENPVVTIRKIPSSSNLKVTVERSYYGVSISEEFDSPVREMDGVVVLSDSAHTLKIDSESLAGLNQVRAEIVTEKDGRQTVICTGDL